MGLSLPIIKTNYQTILQTNVPKEKLGRVASIDMTLSMVISPLGTIIAGPITEVIGIDSLFVICSIILVAIILLIYFLTNLRHVNYNKKDFIQNLENKE
jgi:DHA3 family macrolide efflux protein-like MFS transporter